jgi:hypothetical protein
MNWIAERFEALVAKVETMLTSHSALEKRVEALEALTAEPVKAEPAGAAPTVGG